jgi:hypothetical protein
MWNIVSVHLETVLASTQDRWVRNHFGCTQWFSLVARLKWKLVSAHLEIVLILTQDRCTVCAERTKGLEIIFDAPDGTPM